MTGEAEMAAVANSISITPLLGDSGANADLGSGVIERIKRRELGTTRKLLAPTNNATAQVG